MFKPFNKFFWLLTILIFTSAISVGFISSIKTIKAILIIIQITNTILYFIYKILLINDQQYQQILKEANHDPCDFINEFPPFQLCNMGFIFFPIALLTNNQVIVAFCSFVYPFCITAAICMPPIGFEKYSFKKPRIFGFYLTHYLLLFSAIVFWTSGIYQPQYLDGLYIFLTLITVSIISHIFNRLIIKYTTHKKINFLFTISPEENVILQRLRKLINCPLIYLWPIAVIISIVFEIIIIIIKK